MSANESETEDWQHRDHAMASLEQELRETASELDRVRARLDEATGLLEACWRERHALPYDVCEDMCAFLSRAPAQPTEPEPPLDHSTCVAMGQALLDAKQRWIERAESAEAQLAAARAECESVNGKYRHPDQLEQAVCKAFDSIRALLAQPTGAGTGEPR